MINKLRRKDEAILVPSGMHSDVRILRAPKFVVHYPATPGADLLPQEAAFSREEAEVIWSRVKCERPDLKAQDIRISTVSGEFV